MGTLSHLEALVAAGRIPGILRACPSLSLPAMAPAIDLRDRFQGCLLGVAIGDALGRPGEGKTYSQVLHELGGPLRGYRKWPGWTGGPIGTITDDTQMTMCVASSIVEHGGVVPEDIGARFADWLDYGRGKGRACTEACERLRDGIPWHEAGVDSAGNGAAMRTAPIGLLRRQDLFRLRTDAALVAVITHANPMAIASAVAQSAGIAYCLTQTVESFDAQGFIEFVGGMIEAIETDSISERRLGGGRTTLAQRLAGLPGLLARSDIRSVYDYLYNGAFVLETLPTAFYAFLRNYRDFEATLFAAVDAGYDCDTSGSMAAALAGALHGRSSIHRKWLDDLEFRDELIALANGLFDLTRKGARNHA